MKRFYFMPRENHWMLSDQYWEPDLLRVITVFPQQTSRIQAFLPLIFATEWRSYKFAVLQSIQTTGLSQQCKCHAQHIFLLSAVFAATKGPYEMVAKSWYQSASPSDVINVHTNAPYSRTETTIYLQKSDFCSAREDFAFIVLSFYIRYTQPSLCNKEFLT